MTEGTPSAGGYLVPTPLSQTIIDTRQNVGVSRKTARVMTMAADTLSIPQARLAARLWPTWGKPRLSLPLTKYGVRLHSTCKKRAVLVKISNELLRR